MLFMQQSRLFGFAVYLFICREGLIHSIYGQILNSLAPPKRIDRCIDGNAVKPASNIVWAIERRAIKMAVGLDKDILREVVCLFGIPHYPKHDSINCRLVANVEIGEQRLGYRVRRWSVAGWNGRENWLPAFSR